MHPGGIQPATAGVDPARDGRGRVDRSTLGPHVEPVHLDGADALPVEEIRILRRIASRERPPAPLKLAYDFHRRMAGYAPTPLLAADSLAARIGVSSVWIKDEAQRFGLPAFKILGVSWAGYRAMLARLGISSVPGWNLDRVAERVQHAGPLSFVAATDGNHGHAVAHLARLIGVPARVFVPANMVPARVKAIQDEGATVEAVRGGFDDAVALAAAAAAEDPDAVLLADTSTGVYDEVAEWVIEGYQTIGWELRTQLPRTPDLVLVPIGVGGLAAAIGRTLAEPDPEGRRPLLAGVEPLEAASTMASVAAGRIITLPGPTDSIMAGLSCGTPSEAAWPTLLTSYDLFVAVGAATARMGMRTLRQLGLDRGECSGGAVGALLQLAAHGKGFFPLSPEATVLVIATEGVTDPDNFEALVGSP